MAGVDRYYNSHHMSAQAGYQAFGSTSYVGSTLVFSHEMSSNNILPYEKSVIFVSRKTYEFSDHLGNVSATISDRKITIAVSAGNAVASYAPEVLSQQDYFPFFAALSICDSEWLAMRTQSKRVDDATIPLVYVSNLNPRVEVAAALSICDSEWLAMRIQSKRVDDATIPLVYVSNLNPRVEVGMEMLNRSVTAEGYRYGFNGMEKESDTFEGAYEFGARILDTRLGMLWFWFLCSIGHA